MAKKVTESLVDDIDGSEAVETVKFAIDNEEYEIDLNAKNAKTLRDSLKDFTSAARPVRRGRRTSTAAVRNSSEDLAAIREWAAKNGHEVSPRGRIAKHVVEAYHAAK
ncbi:MAG: Lsr2 family protein [Herbiconiux sp.]|nr:Lsr2 family protein [Herbiconiux sp.]